MTRVREADYRHSRLLNRLIEAASDDAAPVGVVAQRQARADRRQYAAYGTITITNNTTAMLIDESTGRMVSGNPPASTEQLRIRTDRLRVELFLHGNRIAAITRGRLILDMSHGYRTATTRKRLQAIMSDNVSGVYLGTENGSRSGRDYDTYLSTWAEAPGTTSPHKPGTADHWVATHPKAVVTRHRGDAVTTTIKLPVMVGYDMRDRSTDDYRVTIPMAPAPAP